MTLTLEQAQSEINADNFALAKVIREQSDSGDVIAQQIIRSFEAAQKGAGPAQEAFLELYGTWRSQYAAAVAPIAEKLGHALPTNGVVAPPSETQRPIVGLDEPVPTAKRKKSRWNQADVVALTKAILSDSDPNEAIAAFALGPSGHDFYDVRAKAVELKLIEDAKSDGLSEDDRLVVHGSIHGLFAVVDPKARYALFKYASKELHKMIKEASAK
jgi:hypothetical protein